MENQQVNQIQKPTNLYKNLFFGLLAVLIVIVIACGAYYFGQNQSKKVEIISTQSTIPPVYPTVENNQQPEATPSSSVSEKDESVVLIGANTVSFARVGNATYLRYRGKIYDDTNQNEPQEMSIPNANQHTWYGLADAPYYVVPNSFMYDEVFGFKTNSSNKSFVFIMRWGNGPGTVLSYFVYYYNPTKTPKLTFLNEYKRGYGESYNVPKIDQFSNQGNYLSLNMYGCWNCGGHPPETLLIRLSDGEMKRIGKTSYFVWKENGAYEYKEYKIIACPPTPTGEWMGGECTEKPENLPLKTGQF